jgi:hypothetical protein
MAPVIYRVLRLLFKLIFFSHLNFQTVAVGGIGSIVRAMTDRKTI